MQTAEIIKAPMAAKRAASDAAAQPVVDAYLERLVADDVEDTVVARARFYWQLTDRTVNFDDFDRLMNTLVGKPVDGRLYNVAEPNWSSTPPISASPYRML